jgi:exopolysaccharide biosynthesis polyprenyl glycosylphosphotransferase
MTRSSRFAVPPSILVLLLSEFVLLTSCYVLATYWLLPVDPSVFLWWEGGFGRVLIAVCSTLFGLHFLDLYSGLRPGSRISLVLGIGQAIGFAFLVQAFVAYLSKEWMLPRWIMFVASALGLVTLSVWRIAYNALFLHAFRRPRVLFLGFNPIVQETAGYLAAHPETGFANLGYLDDAAEPGTIAHGAKVLGGVSDLASVVETLRPDRIIVGMTERRARMPVQTLLDLRFSGIIIEEAAAAYESASGRVSTKELRPAQLIFTSELGPTRSGVLLQSIWSPFLGLAGTVLTIPLALLAALAVKLSSSGPVLYRQTRVGQNGVPFTLYKFRSMRVDAETDTGAVWASRDDPRATWVGRWMRMLRIDELPQFWNVLRGEMSLVGPRPERPEFVKTFTEKIPYYRQRHCVKPGITGWAQINHKYGDTFEDTVIKLEYDLYYIKHMSISLDGFILFQTMKTMLRSRGAQ